jgi:hypothetical protein
MDAFQIFFVSLKIQRSWEGILFSQQKIQLYHTNFVLDWSQVCVTIKERMGEKNSDCQERIANARNVLKEICLDHRVEVPL